MFIEQLSNEEKSLINALRRYGVEDLGNFILENFCDCDYFLRFWEKAKSERMSKVFGNQLILKKRVNIKTSEEELHNKMGKFISATEFFHFRDKIIKMLTTCNDIDLMWQGSDFNNPWDKTSIRFELRYHMFDTSAMIANRYQGETMTLNLPDGHIFKLVNGCKLMKAMSRLAAAADLEKEFEQIRIRQSQIVNEAYFSANLCLSIHPLDYMTASWNECDWHSCMNWQEGEYRRGVIEMMNSPYVVVAYLESDSSHMEFYVDYEHPKEKWNSKKWREFMIVNEEGIFGIKGYPFWNTEIEELALKWLAELFTTEEITYSTEISLWRVGERIVDESINSELLIEMSCGPAMYNDFYGGNTYAAILSHSKVDTTYLEYSGASECVICGEKRYFEEPGDLACIHCVEHHSCCTCGDPIQRSDELICFNGREYCRYCYENLPECNVCGSIIDLEWVDEDETDALKFVIGETLYQRDEERNITSKENILIRNSSDDLIVKIVCENCASKVFLNKEHELICHHDKFSNWWHNEWIVPLKRITNFELLGISQKMIDDFEERFKEQTEKDNGPILWDDL